MKDDSAIYLVICAILSIIIPAVFFIELPTSEKPADTHTPQTQSEQPELAEPLKIVCSCESSGTPFGGAIHFDNKGDVLLGYKNSSDIGICQINKDAHGRYALLMGLDLYDREDNIRYANWLYTQQGLAPWLYSKKCWGRYLAHN